MASSESVQDDWRTTCTSHLAQMSYALEHGILSDVTFLVGHSKELIKAHRTILSLGSPVFQALLTGKSFDENPIPIPHIQPKEFKPLLKYLYTGKIPEISDGNYSELFKAVKYFMVRRLYPICTQNILKNITSENALNIYEVGKLLEEKELEDAADEFIKKNAKAILAEPKFLELSADNLLHFISADDFCANEISICQAVHKWGEAECDRQKLEKSPENLRLILKNIIPQIRFPLTNPEEFAFKIAPLNLLTIDEHVAMLTYFIIPQNKRGNLPYGGRFISRPRMKIPVVQYKIVEKELDNNDKSIAQNTSLEKLEDKPVLLKQMRIYNGFKIGRSYTFSNKKQEPGITNYLTAIGISNPQYSRKDISTISIFAKTKRENRNFDSHWFIGQGSEPNSYTLFSMIFNGYLSNANGHAQVISSRDQAQNLIFEHSQTPGYYLLNCASKSYNLVLSKGSLMGGGFAPIFINKPEVEDDSILWTIYLSL